MVETPVLFETFVRVEYARQVWDAIKVAQPKKLYFYSNKGRQEKEGEIEKNNEIRSWINEIDWDCELHTWFRDECVDVYTSLRGAITWLFDNEEEGIILEDDCVPTQAFFSFCDQMIAKFRDDMRVWTITGDNFTNENPSGKDYIFSHYHWMYGWASWANRWKQIDWDNFKVKETVESNICSQLFKTKRQVEYRNKEILSIEPFIARTKCWDFILGLKMDQENALSVAPSCHLVSNVGLVGENHKDARETKANIKSNQTATHYLIQNEPPFVFPDLEYDYITWVKMQKPISFWGRVKRRIKIILRIK